MSERCDECSIKTTVLDSINHGETYGYTIALMNCGRCKFNSKHPPGAIEDMFKPRQTEGEKR